jgi:hypothetical protein
MTKNTLLGLCVPRNVIRWGYVCREMFFRYRCRGGDLKICVTESPPRSHSVGEGTRNPPTILD